MNEATSGFEPTRGGAFLQRAGAGATVNGEYSRKKLCFVATDRQFLAETLHALSLRGDCHAVKYSVRPRDGMHLGRCFLLSDDAVGRLWQQFKGHPRLGSV